MPAKKLIRLIIKGQVQGVGFRHYTYRLAQSFALKGFVRNMKNGEVEIIVNGDSEALDTFIERIKKGSVYSLINSISINEVSLDEEYETFNSFQIR